MQQLNSLKVGSDGNDSARSKAEDTLARSTTAVMQTSNDHPVAPGLSKNKSQFDLVNAQKQFDSVQATYNLSDQEELAKHRNKFASVTY